MGASDKIETGERRLVTESPEETMALAERLAGLLQPGDVIALQGTLGAGKTCFVKGLARGIGVSDSRAVTSPSFVLMRAYEGRVTLYHFDAYRLASSREMQEIGCQEIFESNGVSVVEWADHVAACLPSEYFRVAIRMAGETRRELAISAVGSSAIQRLPAFRSLLSPK